jgi:hypothetical protein
MKIITNDGQRMNIGHAPSPSLFSLLSPSLSLSLSLSLSPSVSFSFASVGLF